MNVMNFEEAKGKLHLKLLNEKKIDLSRYAHRKYCDLVLVCCLGHVGSNALVTNKLLHDVWGISEEQLFDAAVNNDKGSIDFFDFGGSFIGMASLGFPGMYVVTNKTRYYGASSLFVPGMLDKVATIIGEDYYVLPSSVHELIVISKEVSDNPESLYYMVQDINKTMVEEKDLLSDNAYQYNRHTGKFSLA